MALPKSDSRAYTFAADGDRGLPLRPPPSFLARLRAQDRDLVVGFNAGAGWKEPLGRWIVGRKRLHDQGFGHVMTVQNPDGTYRPLGDHVLEDLRRIDSWRVGPKEQLRELDRLFQAEEAGRRRRIRERLAIPEKIDRVRFALRKDLASVNFSNITKQDLIAEERRIDRMAERQAAG